MREIKFRALDTGTNEWLYFSLRDLIVGNARHNIRLKNWCQYTGLKDKNGKEIWEGDIVKQAVTMNGEYLSAKDKTGATGKIVWFHDGWSIEQIAYHQIMVSIIEIIGNIYENPELLK